MRKSYCLLFLFFIIPFLSYTQKAISSQKLKNLRGEAISIDNTKINYFVVFSSVNCHECYIKTEEYFVKSGTYLDANQVVNIVVIDNKNNIENVAMRKSYFNQVKKYFPNVNNIYYSDNMRGNRGVLFGKKIKQLGIPTIILIKGGKISKYLYDEFIKK